MNLSLGSMSNAAPHTKTEKNVANHKYAKVKSCLLIYFQKSFNDSLYNLNTKIKIGKYSIPKT